MTPCIVPVSEPSRVADVRRRAMAAADAEGLTTSRRDEVAIIATELATNLCKHAHDGKILITPLSRFGEPGVELLALDRGPGMLSLQACLADGFSTTGTAGTGLGAIRRLADDFDAFSEVDRGTVVVARILRSSTPEQADDYRLGAVLVPCPGEEVCGDNWMARSVPGATSVIVADGLGHGLLAADASHAAVDSFQQQAAPPGAMLAKVHQALRSTRGAAVAIAQMDHHSRRVLYAGVGNIAGVLLGGARSQPMLSHNGTAGLEARRMQEFEYTAPENAILVMHSDGLHSSWSIESYPGLSRRHPSIIAAVLYRDASRGRDDVCVVVGSRRWR